MMRLLIVLVLACAALVAQSTTAPTVLTRAEPAYTEEARAAKITGTVTLQVTVGVDGTAQEIHVVKGIDPGLDLNAVEAVSKWKFKPGTKDGEPVAVRVNIEMNFRLL